MLSEEDRNLIEGLRVEKNWYSAKKIIAEFPR